MNHVLSVLKFFLVMIFPKIFCDLKERGLNRVRLRAVKLYVQSVDVLRRLVLGLIAVFICLALMASGCVLLPIGVVILLYKHTQNVVVAGTVLASVGVGFLLVAMIVIVVLTSQRHWIRLFRIREIVNK